MKKWICVLALVLAFVMLAGCQKTTKGVKEFRLDDYRQYISSSPYEANVGAIESKDDAIAKAEEIWLKVYGDTIKDEKPFQAYYDEKEATWLVISTLEANTLGGSAYFLAEESGEVLAVWKLK